ncbi:MAG TPA: hypothetical protein VE981_02845 [Planctomycetota bacterium]|nr:hypothetical protein [Planctomycetota bacterium]
MWLKTTAIALALALSAFAQDDDAKKKDEEAKAKIADFKKELKGAKSDKDVIRAIEGLGALQHPRVLSELKNYLGRTPDEVAAAAEEIGKYKKDKDAAETLVNAAGARRDKDSIVKCLRYSGDTEYKPLVGKLTGYFRNKDTDVAKESVDSCAKLKSKDAIEPLLNLWRELDAIKEEKAGQGGGIGGIGGGGLTGAGGVGASMQDEQLKRKRDVTPAVESALKKITGEDFKDLRAANDWWRKNKATFKDLE